MFLGRNTEYSELNRLYSMDGFKFVVIYGRRRVGKTSLISEFAKDKDNIFYISIEQNDKAALESFSAKILERFPAAASMLNSFPSWDKAFSYITEQAGNTRMILAIDEYPYLATGCPSISSILQKHIDTGFGASNLFLILCGSSMSFMENQVLGYKSPLYGRRSAQFKIEPFDYYDAALFFPHVSHEDKMLAYAVCGGIPQYLNALAEYENVTDGINECFLKKSGVLYEEPANLLKQELREPAVYNTLIASIARGASRLNEISTKSGEENKKCSKYLKSLLDLHIVKKEQPYATKSERNAIYVLRDNMFRFWYRFIPQNVTNIESGLGRQVFENRILPNLSAYVGHIFEDACRDYMRRINGADVLPFMFNGIGRWWGTNPKAKNQEEIDIIADAENNALFAECKWSSSSIGLDIFGELKRKSLMFEQYSNKTYLLFSKSGFKADMETYAAENNVILTELPALYS
ncbi:MAG: ATP-binding protein [Defluviitaleaceae bacterium]|nr:ATP-binding protein [Defluviitaleaceae bacterium]